MLLLIGQYRQCSILASVSGGGLPAPIPAKPGPDGEEYYYYYYYDDEEV